MFLIHFIDKINAGIDNTYENITCLNNRGIAIKFNIIEAIGIIFSLSFVIFTKFDMLIVSISKITPTVPSIKL